MSRTATRGRRGVEDRQRRVGALAEVAEAHRHRGRYHRAEVLRRRAPALTAKACGEDALAVAALSNRLAVVHKHRGRFAEAGRLDRRAPALKEELVGPANPTGSTAALDGRATLAAVIVVRRPQGGAAGKNERTVGG